MGQTKCNTCFGRGKVRCNYCAGGGRALGGSNGFCPICHGATKVNCTKCSGRGSVYVRDPKPNKRTTTADPEQLLSEARNTPALSRKTDLFTESDWLLGGLENWFSADGKAFAFIISICAGAVAVWFASTMVAIDVLIGVIAFAGGAFAPAILFYLLKFIVGLLTILAKMLFPVLIAVIILGGVAYGLDYFF